MMQEIDPVLIYGEWTYDFIQQMYSAIGAYEDDKVFVFNHSFASLELYPMGYKQSQRENSISYNIVVLEQSEYDTLTQYNNRYIEYIGDHHLCVGGDILTRKGPRPNGTQDGLFANDFVYDTWAMIPEIKMREPIGYFVDRRML